MAHASVVQSTLGNSFLAVLSEQEMNNAAVVRRRKKNKTVTFSTSADVANSPIDMANGAGVGMVPASIASDASLSSEATSVAVNNTEESVVIPVTNLFNIPWAELTEGQQKVFKAFLRDLRTEYPQLLQVLTSLNEFKDLAKKDQKHKNNFIRLIKEHEVALKIFLGYLTTAFPIFIQYLYPPFAAGVSADRKMAWVFSLSGVIVNVALTGEVAGPLFADTIINSLLFIKNITTNFKATLSNTVEYWFPEEWTHAHDTYLEAYAKAQKQGCAYIKLQQLFSLSLPLLRIGVAGLSTYGSWILGKSFAAGAMKAKDEVKYPFDLSIVLSLIAYWGMVVANAGTYVPDTIRALTGFIEYSPWLDNKRTDRDLERKLIESLKRIKFVGIKDELQNVVNPLLNGWLQSCNATLQAMAEEFKIQLIQILVESDGNIHSFRVKFRKLLEDIIKDGRADNTLVTNRNIKRICLPPEVINELISQVLNDKYKDREQYSEFNAVAMQALHDDALDADLRINEKKFQKQYLADLMQDIAKGVITQRYVDSSFMVTFNRLIQFMATTTSLVFALAVVPFFQEEADTDLFSALVAAFIVYYFSDVYFSRAFNQIFDNFQRIFRTWAESKQAAAFFFFILATGLTAAGFSAASAIFQSGAGSKPPGILGTILEFINKFVDVSDLSGFNAAAVNSFGAVQLSEKVFVLVAAFAMYCCKSKKPVSAYAALPVTTPEAGSPQATTETEDNSETEIQQPGCLARLSRWWYGSSSTSTSTVSSSSDTSLSPLLGGYDNVEVRNPTNFAQSYHLLLISLIDQLAQQESIIATDIAKYKRELDSSSGNVDGYRDLLLRILNEGIANPQQMLWFAKNLQILKWKITFNERGDAISSLTMDASIASRFNNFTYAGDDEAILTSMQAKLAGQQPAIAGVFMGASAGDGHPSAGVTLH